MARKSISRKPHSVRPTVDPRITYPHTARLIEVVTEARLRLDAAVSALRLTRKAFSSDGSDGPQYRADVRRILDRAVDDAKAAADALTELAHDGIDGLYDSLDVLVVTRASLDQEELPSSGITDCPVAGALGVAAAGLLAVRQSIKTVRATRVRS